MLPNFDVAGKHYPATPERPDSATHGHLDEGAFTDEYASENPGEGPFRHGPIPHRHSLEVATPRTIRISLGAPSESHPRTLVRRGRDRLRLHGPHRLPPDRIAPILGWFEIVVEAAS